MDVTRRLSPEIAAQAMDATTQYVRMGMRNGRIPIGSANQGPTGRWTYHVSPKLLREYVGDEAVDGVLKDLGYDVKVRTEEKLIDEVEFEK